jgi:rubrerythrin
MYNPFQLKSADDYLIINEADEPEVEDDLDDLEDTENLHSDLEDEEYDDVDTEDDEELEDVGEPPIDEDDGEESSPTEGPDDYDLKDFGNHGGPDVPNNQYNEKDVEILNKLISSESDAINDYFDATTNTVDTNLSRLYGDIGREERFHLEQLMYAKSLITGEKYEPKDPEVKKEYEELIGQGMDEDTAIVTTIDKISVSGGPMSDEEFEDAKEEVAQQESVVFQTQAILDMMEDVTYAKLFNEYCNRLENYSDFYQEEVLNVNTQPKSVTEGTNPISWIIKQFGNLIKFGIKLGSLVREHLRRSRVKRNRIVEWIKYNKISGIFAKGYSFYTYDIKNGFGTSDITKFAEIAYKTTELIAHACNITMVDKPLIDTNDVSIGNVEQGLRLINGMQLMKTKVIVNDSNEDYIKSTLFGARPDQMINQVTYNKDDNGQFTQTSTPVSRNYYNVMQKALITVQQAAQWSDDLAKHLKDMEGKPGIYQTNHNLWLRSIKQLAILAKGFTKIISALNHDINTMLKIDNTIIQITSQYDADVATKGIDNVDPTGVTMYGTGLQPQQQDVDTNREIPKQRFV